jgi:hypothetical protein
MSCRAILSLLLLAGAARAEVAEGALVPAVQGAYIGIRAQATGNPWNAGMGWDFGWREVMYESSDAALAYNYIGMEFVSQAIVQEQDFGVRVVFQPTSFLHTSLAYHRIAYPFGLVSMAGNPNRSEDAIWDMPTGVQNRWADEFTWQWSVQKVIGTVQGRVSGHWSRIDIDANTDSLYLPSQDIVARSRDDIVGFEFQAGRFFQNPFLIEVGPAITTLRSFNDRIDRSRAGLWVQAWPFSNRKGDFIPFWTLRSRVDFWTEHPSRRGEPRLEVTLGWERNLFQPQP